jgi:demethylmenaquinone methyltransferase/2-methoxy-6-polyprenyl-1,4-benzoquinol methylase
MPFDHFGLIAGFYDRTGTFTLTEPLRGLLSLSTESLVLDAGGGTGRVAVVLRGQVRNVIVADVSRPMLRYAMNKGLASVCAPAEAVPFPTGSFNRIIMMDAFHHVFNQQETVREFWRVLSPGGRIAIVEPDIRLFSSKLIAMMEKLLMMRSHFVTGEKIAAFFAYPDRDVSVVRYESSVIVLVEKVRQM